MRGWVLILFHRLHIDLIFPRRSRNNWLSQSFRCVSTRESFHPNDQRKSLAVTIFSVRTKGDWWRHDGGKQMGARWMMGNKPHTPRVEKLPLVNLRYYHYYCDKWLSLSVACKHSMQLQCSFEIFAFHSQSQAKLEIFVNRGHQNRFETRF